MHNITPKMSFKINSKNFLYILSNPRVFIFIAIGIGIIFLTFLTENNAMEVAISGIASVFIGIGVNNFSAIETRMKDERKTNLKIGHLIKIMEITQSKIGKLHKEVTTENYQKIMDGFLELEQFMKLGMYIVEDELRSTTTPKNQV